MKRPAALLGFLLSLLILSLALSPTPGALAQTEYPFASDALLYKNFVSALLRNGIDITDSGFTTRHRDRENGEQALICQYHPTENIFFEVEYLNETTQKFTVIVDVDDRNNLKDSEHSALLAFALTFFSWDWDEAAIRLSKLLASLENTELDGVQVSHLPLDEITIQCTAFEDAIFLTAFLY